MELFVSKLKFMLQILNLLSVKSHSKKKLKAANCLDCSLVQMYHMSKFCIQMREEMG